MQREDTETPDEVNEMHKEADHAKPTAFPNSILQSMLLERSAELNACMKSIYNALDSKDQHAFSNSFLEYSSLIAQIVSLCLKETRDDIDTRMTNVSYSLTDREKQIVALISQGLSNKMVAENLALSEGTVKLHLHRIYNKLHVSGRIQAIYKAKLLQLIP